MSEIPVHHRPRRLADWINPTGARKVHSLVDKVYQRKNLEMAWEKVKANRGSGGVDGQSLEAFAAQVDQQLDRLQSELKEDTYQPQPVRQVQIPKAGKPGEFRMLGVPTIYDRVCQQALLNRLERFEPIFDEANFGYRRRMPCAKCGLTYSIVGLVGHRLLLKMNLVVHNRKSNLARQNRSASFCSGPSLQLVPLPFRQGQEQISFSVFLS